MTVTDIDVKKEEIFTLIINEIKQNNLTPLESYMYLYNIVKLFKEYKEVPEGTDYIEERETMYTLFNEYMSCAGYTTLLVELVSRLGNPNLIACDYGCSFVVDGKKEGHSRCLVRIVDDKYAIDGVYISDPTFDSVEYRYCSDIYDMYNYFLLTKEESSDVIIFDEAFADVTDIFFQTGNFNNDDNFDMDVLFRISKIMFGKEIVDYDDIPKCINSPIPYQTIRRALFTIYSKIYTGGEDLVKRIVEIIRIINSDYQEHSFYKYKYKYKFRQQ